MATAAQIHANRENAQASTGPITPEGKTRCARNALSFGLFSAAGFVRPGEEELYTTFCDEFQATLVPKGAVENTLAAEIIHAAWRLRRCAEIEGNVDMLGLANEIQEEIQQETGNQTETAVEHKTARILRSTSRARAACERTMQRSLGELRRLQTERNFRFEYLPDNFDQSRLGLASTKDVAALMSSEGIQHQLTARKGNTLGAILARRNLAMARETAVTEQTQSQTPPLGTPRNALCPCGSQIKFKRCCGRNSPPILNMAA